VICWLHTNQEVIMKIAYAITRLIKGTDKIDGLVVIVPAAAEAKKVAANLNKMDMDSYSYGVIEAAYYDGEVD